MFYFTFASGGRGMVGIGHILLGVCLLSALAIGVPWEFVPYRFIIPYRLFGTLSRSAELACNTFTIRAGYPGTSERFQCSSARSPEVTSVSSQLFFLCGPWRKRCCASFARRLATTRLPSAHILFVLSFRKRLSNAKLVDVRGIWR